MTYHWCFWCGEGDDGVGIDIPTRHPKYPVPGRHTHEFHEDCLLKMRMNVGEAGR